MNLAVQATILNVLVRSNFPSITLRHPVDAMAPLKSSLVILASAWLSGVRLVMMSVGHFSLSESHSGPCHQSLPSSTSQVWRIFLGGYVAPSDPWMLLNFHRSVCYELFVLAAAVYPMESKLSYPAIHSAVNRKPFNPKFVIWFVAICADNSSNRGMVSPCFASRAFAVTKPWLTSDGCLPTACTHSVLTRISKGMELNSFNLLLGTCQSPCYHDLGW